MAAWDNTTERTYTLEKVAHGEGDKLPLGYLFHYTYKSLRAFEVPTRAAKALIASHPEEDRLHWKELREAPPEADLIAAATRTS